MLVYGWMLFRQPPRPAPTLAIEATIVDARSLKGAVHEPAPAPPAAAPAPQEPEGPPQPSAAELQQREAAREKAQAAAAQAKQAAEEEAAQEAAAQARQADAARQAQEKAKADAQRKAEEQKKAQEAAALAKQQAQDAQEAQEREADLKRSLAAEEHARAVRAGPALASWQAQISARIERAWLRPPTARPGIECVLNVTQAPGGAVIQVGFGECNGDQAVRESIEAAVYRASPLPPPPDPSLFDRNLKINFKPD
jgi:colicin import membrane protein